MANIFIITYLRSDLMLEINTQEQLMIVRLKADLDMTGANVFKETVDAFLLIRKSKLYRLI